MPLAAYKAGEHVVTDCSGWCQCLAYATPGYGNPFGGPWNGLGNTETMLTYLVHIAKRQALAGDFVVYAGPVQDQHAVILLEPGTATDPACGSFGSPGGPRRETVGIEAAAHPGQPVVYLRAVVTKPPARVWQVRTLAGETLGDTKHPVAWAVAHPRAFRRHRVVFDWKGIAP